MAPRRRSSPLLLCGGALVAWLLLYQPLVGRYESPPLLVLAAYDLTLAALAVLVRALSNAKTGALPFLHACSRRGSVRGFLSYLNLVQTIHLHLCAVLDSTHLRFACALLATSPWWMDRRGGWTLVLKGKSTFGNAVDASVGASIGSLLISHVAHLHCLFFGLNLTVALSHFRGDYAPNRLIDQPHFRRYLWWLHATTSADVLLQPLVDRRTLPPAVLPWATAASVLPAAFFALPILAEHVSVVGALTSFLLWCARPHCCLSNFCIALVFTEVFEVSSLLAMRYSLVDV